MAIVSTHPIPTSTSTLAVPAPSSSSSSNTSPVSKMAMTGSSSIEKTTELLGGARRIDWGPCLGRIRDAALWDTSSIPARLIRSWKSTSLSIDTFSGLIIQASKETTSTGSFALRLSAFHPKDGTEVTSMTIERCVDYYNTHSWVDVTADKWAVYAVVEGRFRALTEDEYVQRQGHRF